MLYRIKIRFTAAALVGVYSSCCVDTKCSILIDEQFMCGKTHLLVDFFHLSWISNLSSMMAKMRFVHTQQRIIRTTRVDAGENGQQLSIIQKLKFVKNFKIWQNKQCSFFWIFELSSLSLLWRIKCNSNDAFVERKQEKCSIYEMARQKSHR